MSALQRTAASNSLADAIRRAGFEPYVVSMGRPDQMRGMRGSRLYYNDKDLKLEYQDDVVQHNDVIMMVDVDYHAPMPGYLRYFRPIIMYTLQPKHAAYRCDEFSYYIEDDVVNYHVAGGATYRHKIWDYDHDVICSEYKGYVNFFEVDQRSVNTNDDDSGHRIITLIPIARLPRSLVDRLEVHYLQRKVYSQNGVSMVYDGVSGELSISLSGTRSAVRLGLDVFSALQERLAAKTTAAYTVGDVEVFIVDKAGPDKKVASATIYGALQRLGLRYDIPINSMATAATITTYRPIGSLSLGDEVAPVQQISNPLVSEPALFPARCHDSAEASVKGRVLAVKNEKVPAYKYNLYAEEFVKRLVPPDLVGLGQPWDLDSTIAKQTRPLQKGRIERSKHNFGLGAPNRLETFVKAEAYAAVTDPRNITTCRPEFTVEMSRYVYAFKQDILLNLGWYGPGKTPAEAIQRFREFGQSGFLISDYSRFDGTVSKWLQEHVVRAAYSRWVTGEERDNFFDYFQKVFLPVARSDQGFTYQAGYGTRSGSPITTDGNTMINAFVHYASLRVAGRTTDEAWDQLGLFAGDDGLAPYEELYYQALPLVVCDLGLTVKLAKAEYNEKINYLGRVFPHPMTHDDSHQEAMRTITKLHLSANKTVEAAQAAVNKATGYLVTDSLTPIVGDWARKVLEVYPELKPKSLAADELFKIETGAWPQHDKELIAQSFAEDLNISMGELESMVNTIMVAVGLEFPPLINNKREVKIEAVVGDVVVHPEPVEQCQNQRPEKPAKVMTRNLKPYKGRNKRFGNSRIPTRRRVGAPVASKVTPVLREKSPPSISKIVTNEPACSSKHCDVYCSVEPKVDSAPQPDTKPSSPTCSVRSGHSSLSKLTTTSDSAGTSQTGSSKTERRRRRRRAQASKRSSLASA